MTEKELIGQAQAGDRRATGELCRMHGGFVVQFASKYRREGFERSDFIQIAFIGFLGAIQAFDLSKEVHLITYAVWSIRKAIQEAIRKDRGPETISLDGTGDFGASLVELLPAPEEPMEPDYSVYKKAREQVHKLKNPKHSQYANTMIDLCESGKPFTLKRVGEVHGRSHESIRQARNQIKNTSQMKKLREILRG